LLPEQRNEMANQHILIHTFIVAGAKGK